MRPRNFGFFYSLAITEQYTQWSVIADTRHKVYYYWTMYDRRMRSVDLTKLDFNTKKVSAFPLDRARTEDIEDRSADFIR
jgi:choloylglycine hydrolase